MNLIKQLETHRNHTVAMQKTYKNVTFPQGFVDFLDGLYHRNLSPHYFQRTIVENQYRWFDNIGQGGIRLTTTEHPMVKNNFAGDVTVWGSKDAIAEFEALLEFYEATYEGATKPKDIKVRHQYHETLNPKLWDNKKLKSEVKDKIHEAAKAFVKFLKIENLEVQDIILTGSNANFNWTGASDIDLHLVIDFEKVKEDHGNLVEEYFNAKKNVFNNLHEIMLFGHEIEFYVQNSTEPHMSTGVYSIQNDKWIKEPEHKKPSIDNTAVKAKTAEFMNKIDAVSDCNVAAPVEELMEKLKKVRQAGLEEAGEFSTENLVFKQLRYNGYLEKLAKCKTKAFDRELSIEEEEWESLN